MELEHIGDDRRMAVRKMRERGASSFRQELDVLARGRPRVTRVTGLAPDGSVVRQWVNSYRSYVRANGRGSRGIFDVYHLHEGAVYDVRSVTGWASVERYFCTVRDGEIVRLTGGEVSSWPW